MKMGIVVPHIYSIQSSDWSTRVTRPWRNKKGNLHYIYF